MANFTPRRDVSAGRGGIQTEADFKSRPGHLRRYKTDGLIQLGDDANDAARSLITAVAPSLGAAYQKHLVPAAEDARRLWPVKKKNSRDSRGKVFLRFRMNGAQAEATFGNSAYYAAMIKEPGRRRSDGALLRRGGRRSGGQIARKLIWKPGEIAAKGIARDAFDVLGRS